MVTTLDVSKKSVGLENVCSWLLQFNSGASTNDTLTFRVNRVRYGRVYYMVANSFSDSGTNFTHGNTTTDLFRLTIYFPQKVYLMVIGEDAFNYMDLNI